MISFLVNSDLDWTPLKMKYAFKSRIGLWASNKRGHVATLPETVEREKEVVMVRAK